MTGKYDDPARFADTIAAFKAADCKDRPPVGAILSVGSSTLTRWNETIAQDLAPLTVLARAFGGSTMPDLLHYMDRVVIPYRPRAILLYEGDNDFAAGATPQEIADNFGRFFARLDELLPEARTYVLSIKPSIARRQMWPEMTVANRLIADQCDGRSRTFIDVATPMLDDKGQPRAGIFDNDGLHMKPAGYAIWLDVIRPILIRRELAFEKGSC